MSSTSSPLARRSRLRLSASFWVATRVHSPLAAAMAAMRQRCDITASAPAAFPSPSRARTLSTAACSTDASERAPMGTSGPSSTQVEGPSGSNVLQTTTGIPRSRTGAMVLVKSTAAPKRAISAASS